MNNTIKNMLYEYRDNEEFGKIMIFFHTKCGFDKDYAKFLFGELLEGNI